MTKGSAISLLSSYALSLPASPLALAFKEPSSSEETPSLQFMPTMPAELIARLTQSRSADNRVIGRWVLPVSPFLPQISAEDKRLMASLRPLFTQALREKDSCLDEILLEMLCHASRAPETALKLETLMAPLCERFYLEFPHAERY